MYVVIKHVKDGDYYVTGPDESYHSGQEAVNHSNWTKNLQDAKCFRIKVDGQTYLAADPPLPRFDGCWEDRVVLVPVNFTLV